MNDFVIAFQEVVWTLVSMNFTKENIFDKGKMFLHFPSSFSNWKH